MLGGAERYLERVIFGQKSPCLSLRLSGVQWRIVCLQYVTQVAVISDWYGSNGSMRVRGYVRHLAFGDRGHPKCAMGSKQSLEEVLFGFWLEIRMTEGGSWVARSWSPMSLK